MGAVPVPNASGNKDRFGKNCPKKEYTSSSTEDDRLVFKQMMM